MEYCNGADWIRFPKGAGGALCGTLGDWTPQSVPESGLWDNVAYGNGVFVAVAAWSDGAMVSADGVNWTAHTRPLGGHGGVIHDGTRFITWTPGSRNIAISTDGVNWTLHTNALPEDNDWSGMAYGNGIYVAVSTDGANRVARSTDGINWTAHSAVEASQWFGVTYGNGMFVAVSHTWDATHPVMTSTDGVTWVPQAATSGTWVGIGYGNGLFVVGGAGAIMTSSDGISWTHHTGAPFDTGGWRFGAYGNGRFVVVSAWHGSNPVLTSTDGVTWTTMPSVNGDNWMDAAFGNGRFVATGRGENGAAHVMTAECLSPGCADPDMAAGHIMYNADHRVMQWCDGQTWHAAGPLSPPGPNDGCENPAKPAGNLMFNADYCVLQYCDGDTWRGIGEVNPCACDPDAGMWTANPASNDEGWNGIAYGNGMFVAVGWAWWGGSGSPIMSSPDGINWTEVSVPVGGVADVIFADGKFVVIGGWGDAYTSADGVSWTTHSDQPPGGTWTRIAHGNDTFVAVRWADDNTQRVATSPDGTSWTIRNTPPFDVEWHGVAYGNGRFVAVGFEWSGEDKIMTSDDNGVTWSMRPLSDYALLGIAYGGGQFVAVGFDGHILTSPDGIDWTHQEAAGFLLHNVVFAEGVYVAVGESNQVLVSADGVDWETQTVPENNNWKDVAYGNGRFVAVAENGTNRTITATCLGGS